MVDVDDDRLKGFDKGARWVSFSSKFISIMSQRHIFSNVLTLREFPRHDGGGSDDMASDYLACVDSRPSTKRASCSKEETLLIVFQ